MFVWDFKDGYFHMDMAESMFTYMAFEWRGRLYYFAQCPNGLASACWAFTKLVKVAVAHLRAHGVRCLSYVDDGIGAGSPKSEARWSRDLTVRTLEALGWCINKLKSDLELGRQKVFIGYSIGTVGRGQGLLAPSPKRCENLMRLAHKVWKARKVSARLASQFVGHVVSLRPCLDPATPSTW